MLQTRLEVFFVGLYQEPTKPPYQHLFVILWNMEYNLFKTQIVEMKQTLEKANAPIVSKC